jgi:hypothetical protein
VVLNARRQILVRQGFVGYYDSNATKAANALDRHSSRIHSVLDVQARISSQHREHKARRTQRPSSHCAPRARLDPANQELQVDRCFVCAHSHDAQRKAALVDVPLVPDVVGRHDACRGRQDGHSESAARRTFDRVDEPRYDCLVPCGGRNDTCDTECCVHAGLGGVAAQRPRRVDVDARTRMNVVFAWRKVHWACGVCLRRRNSSI